MEIASDWDKHSTFYVQYTSQEVNPDTNEVVDVIRDKATLSNINACVTPAEPEIEASSFRVLTPPSQTSEV